MKFQLLLIATNLITRIEQANLSVLTLKTWLIILVIIQLVKQMLKNYLNELNEIKTVETIKYKKCTPGHKELLNLFDDLFDIILTNKTLMSSKDKKENENENENENQDNEDEDENENDDIIKILIHSNEYDEETINQNKKNKITKN